MRRVIGAARAGARVGAAFAVVRSLGSPLWQRIAALAIPLLLPLAFAAFAILAGSACAPAPGGGSTGGSVHAEPGDIVGTFELAAPTVTPFILHGTLPVPPGTFPMATGEVPFQVVDYQDGMVPAQSRRSPATRAPARAPTSSRSSRA
jgi:hypothetical protein